ncbi:MULTISPECIES: HNH endonuclease [Halorussus]|uniref:HNH endonuclease n=1 Tax=Halorussus TaxID=1070314 RepID=UPI00209E2B3E|nr:HNH endonuclease [Halorussus vallis]USZ74643.1 HNH endonuclease [Halorussus vallis]
MDSVFRIGDEYVDKGSPKNPEDEFLRLIRGPLKTGIKNTGGIRDLSSQVTDDPAAIVIVSNDTGVSQYEDPWQDVLAVSLGHIDYWGDAKKGNPYDESQQNEKVKRAFDQAARGNRDRVPPILVFRKPRSGVVQFCGLCVPDHIEVDQYADAAGNHVPNYLFHLTILNTDTVSPTWMHNRVRADSDERAPEVWKTWVKTGEVEQWPTGEAVNAGGRRRRYEREEVTVSPQFRTEVFDRYKNQCAMTGIGHPSLLDLAHVLPRSEHPERAEDPKNALVLNSLHHRAFDAGLFTLDADYRLRVDPSFNPEHPFLRESIVERQGTRIELPSNVDIGEEHLEKRNAGLGWL